jgi:hypothetical protein
MHAVSSELSHPSQLFDAAVQSLQDGDTAEDVIEDSRPEPTEVNVDIKKAKKIRARKDADKQEAVIKLDAVRENIDHLLSLFNASADAATAYGEAVKAIAEKAGLQASVVRKFVSARASENF